MSFGRNPYVAKAEAAELKAQSATDDVAYEQAWRDAARQWDRAADREADAKRRALYGEKAETARANADGPRPAADLPDAQPPKSDDSRMLN
jgi:hypothetical protein